MITQEAQQQLQHGSDLSLADSIPSCSMSQRPAMGGGPSGGATLLHELISFLRRCLGQQPEVRRAVYEGLPTVLAADPEIQVRWSGGGGAGAVPSRWCSPALSPPVAALGMRLDMQNSSLACPIAATCLQESVVEPLLPHFCQVGPATLRPGTELCVWGDL